MRRWSERLEKAMDKSTEVRTYIEEGWNALYNDIMEYGPMACLDSIALDAMVDMEEHNIRVFSL